MNPFASRRSESVAALGERELIRRISKWLGPVSPRAPYGIGDDCALLGEGARLVTVDPVVYGRHFDASVPPAAVGAKLLKRNLSDIAAMGGRPTAAVLGLALDATTRTAWLDRFYRGLAGAARRYGVSVVGGDVAEAPGALVASLTLLGNPAGKRVLTRTGARSGDLIYVTGELGRSLETGHHWRFEPRLKEGAWLAGRTEVAALMDVSDGLAKDLGSLTPRNCVPALFGDLLPRRARADLKAALGDGEDYELLLAVRRDGDAHRFERDWRRRFPKTRLTCIGKFTQSDRVPPGVVDLGSFAGYEHLAAGRGQARRLPIRNGSALSGR